MSEEKRFVIQIDPLEIEDDAIFDNKELRLYECQSDMMSDICGLLNQQENRIAELEEQLKNAIVLPVKLGDKIYVVPSKTNFKINNIHHKERNRVYEWEVHEIRFNKYGYAIVSWIDNIPFFCVNCETTETKCTYEPQRFYGETWFKTKEEALKKLEEYEAEE